MIRVNVMYPKQEGGNFDYDYYVGTHMPLVKDRLGDALKRMQVYKGITGAGDTPETYVTLANLFFNSVDEFGEAFSPHAEEIMADIVNFTNIEPTIQIEDQLMDE